MKHTAPFLASFIFAVTLSFRKVGTAQNAVSLVADLVAALIIVCTVDVDACLSSALKLSRR
jgi:hypothetical protein